jgi:hypothetical protein
VRTSVPRASTARQASAMSAGLIGFDGSCKKLVREGEKLFAVEEQGRRTRYQSRFLVGFGGCLGRLECVSIAERCALQMYRT